MNHDMVVPKQDEKIRKLLEGGIQGAMASALAGRMKNMMSPKAAGQDVKFKEMFPDIKEDNFESSEDEEEKQRNERLERLGQVVAKTKGNDDYFNN